MPCTLCEQEKPLVRHHISYEPEVIVMLCRSCHGKEHREQIRVAQDRMRQLKQQGRVNKLHLTWRDHYYDVPAPKTDLHSCMLEYYQQHPLRAY